MKLEFFDCYCSIGEKTKPVEAVCYKKEDIKKKLESFNVKKAFCFHNAENSNDVLKKELESDEFFLPSYALNIKDGTQKFEKLFKEYNAKMINANPVLSGYSLDVETLGDYLDTADKYSAVMTIPSNSMKKDKLEEILKVYRNIKIITVNSSFSDISHVKELMRKYDNLYLDTGYTSLCGLEDVANAVGFERIVYSSYMPEIDPSGGISRVILLSASDDNKEKIAYKNISALTGVSI